jgi:hypothetical protein
MLKRFVVRARTISHPGWRLFGALVLAVAAVVAGGAWVGNATAAGDSIGVPGLEKYVVQNQHRAALFLLLTISLELLGGMLLAPLLPTHVSEPSVIRFILGSVLGAILIVLVSAIVLTAFAEISSLHRMARHGIH